MDKEKEVRRIKVQENADRKKQSRVSDDQKETEKGRTGNRTVCAEIEQLAAVPKRAADTSFYDPYRQEEDTGRMSIEEWTAYEFHRDYADVFSDVTGFLHEDLRRLLDVHWSSYIKLTSAGDNTSREEKCAALAEWHKARLYTQRIKNANLKRIYLWPGDAPSVTSYRENTGYQYADDPDFRPYLLAVPSESETVRGAVILAAGGAHLYRSNVEEAYESALSLNRLGYHCFIVNYRVAPYTDEESALDIERAVRVVRGMAGTCGFDKDHIAVAGFSYGGIVSSLAADRYFGRINAAALVPSYQPDAIDAIDGTMNAYLAIYSVTPDKITNPAFPPTFFAVGSADDSVRDWAIHCFNEENKLGIPNELHLFAGAPHGFGAGRHADGTYYANAALWPQLADVFMQNCCIEISKTHEGQQA